MKNLLLFILITFLFACSAPVKRLPKQAEKCLKYEPQKVQIDFQIIISRVRNQLKENMIGKLAIIKGELLPQTTGHHRTKTFFSADSIELVNESIYKS